MKRMNKSVLSKSDSEFLSYFRGLSIFIIVFGHVGGFWAFKPYSEFLHVFVPAFFFISGAVSYYSYNRSVNAAAYYKKRFVGLLVPYYLLCVLSLLVFIVIKHEMPIFNIHNLLKWIQIRPSNNIMSFPIGQVWFLNTLFFITAISPLYFKIYNKSILMLYVILIFIICFSATPLFFNVREYLYFFGNNLYRPLIHSSFYIFGIIVFSSSFFRKKNVLMSVVVCGFSISILSVFLLKLNVDYSFHIFSPDIYYVSGSFAAISLMLILKDFFLKCINKSNTLKIIFIFFCKHTFSIFLLHSFGILISENLFGLVEPAEKTITYGLIKLFVVLVITCLLAIPYTELSRKISVTLLLNTKKQ